jgi:hypothetical protein
MKLITITAVENFGLTYYQLALVFVVPILVILGTYELYTLFNSKKNNRFLNIRNYK